MGDRIIKLKKEDAVLVGIDFQERLMPAMGKREEVEEASAKLVKGCRIMGVPVIMTQQYTKGLGTTIAGIQTALTEPLSEDADKAEFMPVEKTSFSAMGEPTFVERLSALNRKTVIISGVEAHVCVQQTVIDLIESGYTVFVACDCISSRSKSDKKHAQRRMENAGAIITTMEAIVFELCGGAKEPGFKQISALVK